MPASLLSDMNSSQSDHRFLENVALELSAMELSKSFADKLGLGSSDHGDHNNLNGISSNSYDASGPSDYSDAGPDQPLKKPANMTAEKVKVPTSEHVAEIVGRQGCKIKALRAKTNTYIRTPIRGQEPEFVVTGKKEDVLAAKREILSAADHFSQIRASRRNNSCGGTGGLHGPPSPSTPGQVTIQVRVPYRVVGLVVGPKGATIKRIQQQTQTYIVTPSRDKEPIFEVTGLPDNVEKARHEIESHIALRTGGVVDGPGGPAAGMVGMNNGLSGSGFSGHHSGHMGPMDDHVGGGVNDFQTNGVDAGELGSDLNLMGSLYKPPSSNSAFSSYTEALNRSNNSGNDSNASGNIFAFPNSANHMSSKMEHHQQLNNGFTGSSTTSAFGLYDSDEGIGSSPSFDGSSMMGLSGTSIWSDFVDMQAPHSGTMMAALGVSSASNGRNDALTSSLSPTDSSQLDNQSLVEQLSATKAAGKSLEALATMGIAGMSAFTPLSQQSQQHFNVNVNASTASSLAKLSSGASGSQSMGLSSSSTSTSPTDSTGSLGGGPNNRNSGHAGFVALDNDVSPW